MDWSEGRILERISSDMERLYPGFTESIQAVQVTRWQNAIPHHDLGKSLRIARYREDVLARQPEILFAGDYTGFYGTDGAANTGLWAAQRILQTALAHG
jgi:oxygen-dependent protoporphyrinogen oxidase